VNVQESSLVVTGINVPQYAFTSFSYNSTTYTATWTLAHPITLDKVLIDLQSTAPNAVTNFIGKALDGAWMDQASNFPSGDGTAGDFNFHFNVTPGDADQDGIVNGLDIALVASHWLSQSLAGDVNVDGIINGLDIALIASNWLSTLPAGSAAANYSVVLASPSTGAPLPKNASGQYVALAGTSFQAQVYVEDARSVGASGGVQAAFADLSRDLSSVTWMPGSLAINVKFATSRSGSINTVQEMVDEAGGVRASTPVVGAGIGELLFTVTGTVSQSTPPGTIINFTTSAATGAGHTTTVFGSSTPVAATYGTAQLIVPTDPWQNPVNPFDVNGDRFVTALDLSTLINRINQGFGEPGGQLPQSPVPPNIPPPYLDVTGDGFLTVLDYSMVLNYLNTHPVGSSTSQALSVGSSSPMAAAAASASASSTSSASGIAAASSTSAPAVSAAAESSPAAPLASVVAPAASLPAPPAALSATAGPSLGTSAAFAAPIASNAPTSAAPPVTTSSTVVPAATASSAADVGPAAPVSAATTAAKDAVFASADQVSAVLAPVSAAVASTSDWSSISVAQASASARATTSTAVSSSGGPSAQSVPAGPATGDLLAQLFADHTKDTSSLDLEDVEPRLIESTSRTVSVTTPPKPPRLFGV
jgi:hypothetical protein